MDTRLVFGEGGGASWLNNPHCPPQPPHPQYTVWCIPPNTYTKRDTVQRELYDLVSDPFELRNWWVGVRYLWHLALSEAHSEPPVPLMWGQGKSMLLNASGKCHASQSRKAGHVHFCAGTP